METQEIQAGGGGCGPSEGDSIAGPLTERVRALRRRARTYKVNGVTIHEPNSDTRARALTEAASRVTVRSARAQLIQHTRREGVRGTPLRRLCVRLAHGERINVNKLADAMIAPTGAYSWAAPAAERLLVNGQAATDDERRFLQRLARRSVSTAELRAWLADDPTADDPTQTSRSLSIADTPARTA